MRLCIANSKGGVGKTTTVIELAAHSVRLGRKVLIVDTDMQGNASRMLLGKVPSPTEPTLYNALIEDYDLTKVIRKADEEIWPNTWVLPSNKTLDKVDVAVAGMAFWVNLLSDLLDQVEDNFDLIIIDTAPQVTAMTQMALMASHSLIIPTDISLYSDDGVELILGLVDAFESRGHSLKVSVVPTQQQKGGAKAVRHAMNHLKETYPSIFQDVSIPHCVKVAEGQRQTPPRPGMHMVDPDHKLYRGYEQIAQQLRR